MSILCGSKNDLTFDHLLPRSKGGKTDFRIMWLPACSSCNVQKGGRLLKTSGMKLNQLPYQPTTEDLHRNGKNFPPNFLHKSWMDYLYWDVELERQLNFFPEIVIAILELVLIILSIIE